MEVLARDALSSVESGYYGAIGSDLDYQTNTRRSLVQAIRRKPGGAIISEIKFASPSAGYISNGRLDQVSKIAREMEAGGASGLSVLTERKNFKGSLGNLTEAKKSGSLPVIMKDIIVSREQIDAARKIGADAILFIEEIFSKNYALDLSLNDAVKLAKKMQLEVIVETHEEQGLKRTLGTECDIIGINNRDLETFEVNIETTTRLLRKLRPDQIRDGLLIMSESGFESPSDIQRIKMGAGGNGGTIVAPHAFLIGTSIMKSDNVRNKVREFVEAVNTV